MLPMEAPSKRSFLTWDEVRTMAAAGVTFESHTVNHVLLAVERSEEEITAELIASKRRIQEEIGYEPTMFAYPSGSFDARTMQLVAQAGYSDAFTTEPGSVNATSNRLSLPRVAIDDDLLVDGRRRFSKSRAQFHLLRHLWRGKSWGE
jgi:peptidoglycan/xylan/chitin deacetylase (PgdA/CDA1 family)